MGRIYVEATANSDAPPATVYRLAKDSSSYPTWSMIGSYELIRPGAGEINGVGQIRVFRTGLVKAREEIVELTPDQRVGYVLLGGMPLRDYRASIDLSPASAGRTLIHWHSSFLPRIPGTGWACRLFMQGVLTRLAAELAAAAQRGL